MSDEIIRSFGYNAEKEDRGFLDRYGQPHDFILQALRAAYPTFNPFAEAFTNLQSQGAQGSCQGHALAHIFQIAGVQKYSRQLLFSRAAGYYLAQKFDGIRGDQGSTLAGGQKVANSGLCLEKEWPYPSRYDPTPPSGIDDKLKYTMKGSRPISDADLAWELLGAGAMLQTGVAWTSAFEQEVCSRYTASGNVGGHSTVLYGLTRTNNAIHHNSWRGWMGDMRNEWTKDFFAQILRNDRWAVFVAYESSNLNVPATFFDA